VYYFSERGFFDADKVNRSLHDGLLRYVMADQKITQLSVSVTNPSPEMKLWDSLAKWIGNLEKFLFTNYQSQEGTTSRYAQKPILLESVIPQPSAGLVYELYIHRLPDGRWADYSLALQVLDFLEPLINKLASVPPSNQAAASFYKYLEAFLRFEVNILLATLQDTTIFSNTEKALMQQTKFKQLQTFAENERSRIKEATVAFIKAKMSQYTTESDQTGKVLDKTLKRLIGILPKLLGVPSEGEVNKKRVLYITTFLYKFFNEANDKTVKGILSYSQAVLNC
jgi:hypothetical protein